jgi:hypothetical protein
MSTEYRSRKPSTVVSITVARRIGAGTNPGSMKMRIGDAKSPNPNPIEPCSVEPTRTVAFAIMMSAQLKEGLGESRS